ncbi:MAG TPA: DNA-binding protein [Clostridium sp.]|nr:DNA-binding protein [Clostridia bacterium]HCW04148.1 DNA-binding protein [Clostridium sp.]
MNKKNKIIGSAIIAGIFLIFTVIGYINDNKVEDYNEIFVESKPVLNNKDGKLHISEKTIKVEIKGEVNKPGVYEMKIGSRLEDLIKEAGGLTVKADSDRIPSLAKKLRDEDCIVVANIDKAETVVNTNSTQDEKSDIININTADKDQLEKIPGVGPVTAEKILEYREEKGYFNSIEDLKNINGIGEKTFENMKDKISVD